MDPVTHKELLYALISQGAAVLGIAIYVERRLSRIETFLKMKENGKAKDVLP